jgi:hypothetical protein
MLAGESPNATWFLLGALAVPAKKYTAFGETPVKGTTLVAAPAAPASEQIITIYYNFRHFCPILVLKRVKQ